MRIINAAGLPIGDTENPELIAVPREGIPEVIDTPHALEDAALALEKGTTPLALDVERAQGFRYGTKPYLVQIRREGVGTFLIDTAALPDLTRLSTAVSDLWILHDATQDLPNLRQSGLRPTTLFGTAIAAKLLGYERFGDRKSVV